MELPDDPELIRSLEMIEAEAMASMLLAMPGDLQEQLGAQVKQVGSATALVVKQMPFLLLNRVIGLGIEEPATEQMVNEVCRIYEQVGVPTGVQLSPVAQPEQLKEWVEGRGVNPTDTWAKLYRGTEPVSPVETDLKIEQIGQDRAAEFGAIVATSFHMPEILSKWLAAGIGREGWRYYMALDGGKGVGVAALYFSRGVGWLGAAGTLPESRGRGAQSALIARRISDGIEMGCRWFVVETDPDTPERPNPSYRNLVKLGFKPAYERQNYRS